MEESPLSVKVTGARDETGGTCGNEEARWKRAERATQSVGEKTEVLGMRRLEYI